MTIRKLLTKIDAAIRPPHVKGQEPQYDPLDARVLAHQALGNQTGLPNTPVGAPGGTPITGWVPSQQDEKPE